MGQSKGGGYTQKPVFTQDVNTFLKQLLQQSGQNTQQAAQGFQQFLPGGGGGEAIQKEALRNYQQQTIPSILNAFGSDNKGSSSLNQALAGSAADLNSSLGSQLAQMQLSASQGLGSLGLNQQQTATQPRNAYLQRQPPQWQQILQSALGVGGPIAAARLGRSSSTTNFNLPGMG